MTRSAPSPRGSAREAIRVGQALGYDLEEILHLDAEIIAKAGEGDDAARRAYDAQRLADTQKPGGGAHRASMGQDMMKGRRTEIEYLNGFVVARGAEIGIAAPANAALTEIVKRVERGEVGRLARPDPRPAAELNGAARASPVGPARPAKRSLPAGGPRMPVSWLKERIMKIAVMGAGSVGCYYGGMLARSGLAVTLVGRGPHVDAMTRRGLVLEIGEDRHVVPVAATTQPDGVADADVVLFCVKSGDTEAVGRAMAPHLRPDVTILNLQNGVDNADRLRAILGGTVVPVAVYVATAMAGPGHVKHHGRGELVMGPCARDAEIVARFGAAGIPTTVSANAIDALWAKLIVNCAYNALSALTQLPYGRLLGLPGVADVMKDVVGECIAVAQASGVSVAADTLASVLALAASMPGQRSSTAQDLAQGKPTEIDHLNGFVIRKGEALGIPTPANRVLHTLVKAADAAAKAERPALRRPTAAPVPAAAQRRGWRQRPQAGAAQPIGRAPLPAPDRRATLCAKDTQGKGTPDAQSDGPDGPHHHRHRHRPGDRPGNLGTRARTQRQPRDGRTQSGDLRRCRQGARRQPHPRHPGRCDG